MNQKDLFTIQKKAQEIANTVNNFMDENFHADPEFFTDDKNYLLIKSDILAQISALNQFMIKIHERKLKLDIT